MEITYIGHSSFKIKGKDVSLIIDPYDPKIGYKYPKQDCDILLVSHQHFDHNYVQGVSDYKILIDKPGEYEVSGVFINGIQTFHDNTQGSERGNNTIFLLTIDGFNVLHLGDLGHELSKEQMERIGQVDVLLIPIGGKYTIDSEVASKVISSIEPGYVIPMHYQTADLTGVDGLDPLSKFLDEMGVDVNLQPEEKLKLSNNTDIPLETTVFVLNPKH
jgi:L-ascorbate metabolism protein UlaG (beta-lactamase superfamily)